SPSPRAAATANSANAHNNKIALRAAYISIQDSRISMRGILSDLKLVIRQLRNSPGVTATAVLMLAFGIGATTAIFSIVDGVLPRPLPFPQANRLVSLGDHVSNSDWGKQAPGPVTGPEVIICPRDPRSFESLGGFAGTSYELSGIGQ